MRIAALLLVLHSLSLLRPARADGDAFAPLFNGQDLAGWVNVNCAPETFTVREGLLISTGVPMGFLRTEKQYENFVVEFEWRQPQPGGNAGLFVWGDALPAAGVPFARGIEIQILDQAFVDRWEQQTGRKSAGLFSGHGDVFSIHGAAMKPLRPHPQGWARNVPAENRCRPAPEWNQYRVECQNGDVTLAVNGKEVSGATGCVPRKGHLCLESEGSECHFRNIRLREKPSTGPAAAETAQLANGFRSLYTGVDLSGWKEAPGHRDHWRPLDWVLDYDGKSEADDKQLWSEQEFGDFELICDWRLPAPPVKVKRPVVLPNGDYELDADGTQKEIEVDDAGDSGIYLRGSSQSQVNIWCWPVGSGEVFGYRTDRTQPAEVRAAVTPRLRADRPIGQWNRFVITMRGERLTVVLNGQRVIEDTRLPGVPAKGPIALQHHGDPVQFANLFIRELE
ncbi:MAG: 3-keto-disaccharide hydrolase [Planctomycetaceae bacterium]